MRRKSSLRDRWKDYFTFSKKLRNALLALFLVMVIEIATLFYLHFTPASSTPTDFSEFQKEIDAFYASQKADSLNAKNNIFDNNNSEIKSPELFAFNPNNLSEEDWKRLGFSDKQIHVIKNYENKGGRFRTKADVKKMYSISGAEFALIGPYIQLPDELLPDSSLRKTPYKKYERPVVVVDIGTADTLELLKIPAIGPSFSRRIANYREKLGGFY
jgi:competence protein ComEA